MTGLANYLLLEAAFVAILALVVARGMKIDIVSALHFALLSSMAYQCLVCLGLAYFDIPLSFISLNWPLLTASVGAGIVTGYVHIVPHAGHETPSIRFDRSVILAMAFSYLGAAIAGLLFFSVDLVPSSMTGDPARHFQGLVDLAHPGLANAMKPVYYLWAGIVSDLPGPLARDQLFVVFNIFCLGLTTSGASLLMLKTLGQAAWREIFIFALLVTFGFPYFALQYGYYTLLLSAAFLFAALVLLHDYLNSGNELANALAALLGCGVVLSHSYFLPDFFFASFALALWKVSERHIEPLRLAVQYVPYWILIGSVAILSNSFLRTENPAQSIGEIIRIAGFVTPDFWRNILLTLPLAAPFFLDADRPWHKKILLLYLVAVAVFSLAMYGLYTAGFSAPYYVNRNQLVLLPLLAIAVVGTLQCMERQGKNFPRAIQSGLLVFVVGPLLVHSHQPLALSDIRLRELLYENSGFLYFVNAKTASYSPLQFTARDRDLLTSPAHRCFDIVPQRMAVLGTDHQVMWFGIYANLYPSLMVRDDMFVGQAQYLANYELWKNGSGGEYIAVIRHTNYLIPREVLREIGTIAKLTCAGDSFAVYRKSAR